MSMNISLRNLDVFRRNLKFSMPRLTQGLTYITEAQLERCQLTPLEFWRLAQLDQILVCTSVKYLIDTPR